MKPWIALLLGSLCLAAPGCGLSRQAPLAFHASSYAIHGRVERGDVTLAGQLVKLYTDGEVVLLDSLRTDAEGEYGFRAAPAGPLLVKVSSDRPGDFTYVRARLLRASATARDSVPPLDVSAHGCALASPAEGALVPAPDPTNPIDFLWSLMDTPARPKYKVRLADSSDATVWEPAYRTAASDMGFNGFGTDGVYAGVAVPPGRYAWRVKTRLLSSDSLEITAATEVRRLDIAASAASGARP